MSMCVTLIIFITWFKRSWLLLKMEFRPIICYRMKLGIQIADGRLVVIYNSLFFRNNLFLVGTSFMLNHSRFLKNGNHVQVTRSVRQKNLHWFVHKKLCNTSSVSSLLRQVKRVTYLLERYNHNGIQIFVS